MTRRRTRPPKTGAGRTTIGAPKVPSVESLACPDRDGSHWLINDRHGRTYCRGCKVPWATLDAAARGGAAC